MSGVPSASTLYQDAKHTALTATSAHVQGSETDNGEKITIDVIGRTDATNMQETVEKNEDGRLTVLVVDGRFWVRGDRATLSQFAGTQAASRIGSKWVQVPSSKGSAFVKTTSLKTLLQKMFSSDITAADDEGTRVTLTELGGKPAYRMSDTGDDFSMWISTDPDHHAMRIGGPKEGYIDFTDWNSAPLQKAPAASEVYHP